MKALLNPGVPDNDAIALGIDPTNQRAKTVGKAHVRLMDYTGRTALQLLRALMASGAVIDQATAIEKALIAAEAADTSEHGMYCGTCGQLMHSIGFVIRHRLARLLQAFANCLQTSQRAVPC